MAISQVNIIIVAAVAVLIATTVDAIVRRSGPIVSGIYSPCDGYTGPVDHIRISACLSPKDEDGTCEIDTRRSLYMHFDFIPDKDMARGNLSLSDSNGNEFNIDACGESNRLECPAEAGRKQTVRSVTFNFFKPVESTKFKLKVFDPTSESNEVAFCAEFIAKIV